MSDVTKCLKSGFNFHTGVEQEFVLSSIVFKFRGEAVFA